MRSFSIIAASLVLALTGKCCLNHLALYWCILMYVSCWTANAASIGKRAITPGVQTCIDDINAAGVQLGVVQADVSSWLYRRAHRIIIWFLFVRLMLSLVLVVTMVLLPSTKKNKPLKSSSRPPEPAVVHKPPPSLMRMPKLCLALLLP